MVKTPLGVTPLDAIAHLKQNEILPILAYVAKYQPEKIEEARRLIGERQMLLAYWDNAQKVVSTVLVTVFARNFYRYCYKR